MKWLLRDLSIRDYRDQLERTSVKREKMEAKSQTGKISGSGQYLACWFKRTRCQ